MYFFLVMSGYLLLYINKRIKFSKLNTVNPLKNGTLGTEAVVVVGV